MANIKITDLDAYTDPKSTDVLPAVDVTNDETKKVSIADLMENAGSGTEGSPGIRFDGDSGTGMWRPGNNTLAFSTGGVKRLEIASDGEVTIPGDLTVQGTTTTIDSETLVVQDKNIELGVVDSPTDTTADGGGITLKGATDKTLNWVDSTDSWTSSENVDLASGKTYKIAGTDVLSGSTLGSGVTGSSLTSVGTITTGVWNGTALTADAIGADAINGTKIADDSIDSEHYVDGSIDSVHLSADCVDGSKIADDSIDSEHYVDGSIDNVHVSASAAIAGTKISADFGAQNLTVDTNVLFVDATNNRVGVGTASPESKLVVSDAGSNGIEFIPEVTTDQNLILSYDRSGSARSKLEIDSSELLFTNANDELMRIDSDGRLLIGTNIGNDTGSESNLIVESNSSGSTSYGGLMLRRGSTTIESGTSLGRIYFADQSGNVGARISGHGNDTWAADDYPGYLLIETTSDGAAAPTERVRIRENLFRIGTSSSTAGTSGTSQLQLVDATNNVEFILRGTSPRIVYDITGTNEAELYYDNRSFVIYRGTPAGTPAESMRIDSDGRLLVGTNSDITGGATSANIQAVSGGGGNITVGRNDTTVGEDTIIGGMRFFSNATDGNYDECARIVVLSDTGGYTSTSKPTRIEFRTTASGEVSPTTRMTIKEDGNVGINTENPDNKLEIGVSALRDGILIKDDGNNFGALDFDSNRTTADAVLGDLRFLWNGTAVARISGESGSDTTNKDDGHLTFMTASAGATQERVRIDSSGRLLIGTPSDYVGNTQALLQLDHASGPLVCLRRDDSTVSNGNLIGDVKWLSSAGGVTEECARIRVEADGTQGSGDKPSRMEFWTTADSASGPSERMRINDSGDVTFGNMHGSPGSFTPTGATIGVSGYIMANRSGNTVLFVNRKTNDGRIVTIAQADNTEGSIDVSGSTVSFNGGHLSRWSQLPGGVERTEILRGSVLSNLDEMCEWGEEENEQLNRMQVSTVEGDRNVAGVFQSWDDDDDTYTDDFYCAMTGDFIIRIAQGVTVERGDLLMSAGDGTAKPQDDDIIRSKTIAKVTSTNVSCTYADGSYCVPCVLMAC